MDTKTTKILTRYSELPVDGNGNTPDISLFGHIYRIYTQKNQIHTRTENGGWRCVSPDDCDETGVMHSVSRLLGNGGNWVHTLVGGETELVTTSQHVPVTGEIVEMNMAGIVSAQWLKASAGLAEIIKFGAIMVKVDQGLASPKSRVGNFKGQTLKGWLSANCPEVNYNTARGYKDAALGLAAAAELPDAFPLLSIMGGDEAFTAELQEAHDKVMAVLASSSIAFLKASSRRGGARIGAGRPVSAAADPDADIANARLIGTELITNMRRWVLDEDGLGDLPDSEIEAWLEYLADVVKRGREIIAGRKAAAAKRI